MGRQNNREAGALAGLAGYFHFSAVMVDDLFHNKLTPLDGNWAQDSFSPIPTFVDTGATLIDKSNVDSFLKARDSAQSQ